MLLNSGGVRNGYITVAVSVAEDIAALCPERKAVVLSVTLSLAALYADDRKTFDLLHLACFLVPPVAESLVLDFGHGGGNLKLLDILAAVEKEHRGNLRYR